MEENKKGKLWIRLLCIVIAVAVVAAGVLLAIGIVRKNDRPPAAEGKGIFMLGDADGMLEPQDMADETAGMYGRMLRSFQIDASAAGTSTDISITLGEELESLLSLAMIQNGMDGDLSWLEEITISTNMFSIGDLAQSVLTAGINGQQILSLDMIVDTAGQMVYIGVPELNEQYLAIEASILRLLGGYSASMLQKEQYREVAGMLPSEADVHDVLSRYAALVESNLPAPAAGSETLTCGEISKAVTAVTYTMTYGQLLEMAEQILTVAQTDTQLEAVLDAFARAYNYFGAQEAESMGYTWYDEDFHANLMEAISDALAEIQEEKNDQQYLQDIILTYTAYTIDQIQVGLKVVGYDITHDYNEETDAPAENVPLQEMVYYSLTDGDNTAMVLEMKDQLRITGTGTDRDGLLSGTYTVTAFTESREAEGQFVEEPLLTLELKDCDLSAATQGQCSGTVIVYPAEALMEEIPQVAAIVGEPKVEIRFQVNGSNAELSCKVYDAENLVLGVALTSRPATEEEIRIPGNYVHMEFMDELMLWAQNVNFDQVMDNLEKANVPAELIAMLEQMLYPSVDVD